MFYQKIQKPLVLFALVGAMLMATMADSTLAYIGILYYIICFIAVIKSQNHTVPNLLLWSAVGVHIILICYSLWIWNTVGIIPCFFCMAAAGFSLIAAVASSRLSLSPIPILLLTILWYTWPY